MTHRATTRLRRRERILRAKNADSTLPRLASRIARFGGSVAHTSSANPKGAA